MTTIPQQDWAAKWALYSPAKVAFKELETGRTLTYRELNDRGNRLAHHLWDTLGLEKGDRIAILAENCLEYLLLFVAAQKTGVVLVPLNYRLTSAEIDYLLTNAEPALVIGEDKFAAVLAAAPAFGRCPRTWDLADLAAFCAAPAPGGAETPNVLVPVAATDPIFILYTSGTTGFPKGALYTHQLLFWNSINTALSL